MKKQKKRDTSYFHKFGMSKATASLLVGRDKSYFNVLKLNFPKVYRTYQFFGKGDLVRGFEAFDRVAERLKNDVIAIAYDKGHYEMSKWLFKHDFYGSRITAYSFITIDVYHSAKITYPHFIKLRDIVKLYKKEMKANNQVVENISMTQI